MLTGSVPIAAIYSGSVNNASGAVSVFNSEGPPVPIPNTAVKLVCAHNTRLETAREDRSMLTLDPTYYARPCVMGDVHNVGDLYLYMPN